MIIKLMDNNGISVRMVKLCSQSVSNKPISITFKNCIDNSFLDIDASFACCPSFGLKDTYLDISRAFD